MRATVRAVLPVPLVLFPFSSTVITPQSSLAPAMEEVILYALYVPILRLCYAQPHVYPVLRNT